MTTNDHIIYCLLSLLKHTNNTRLNNLAHKVKCPRTSIKRVNAAVNSVPKADNQRGGWFRQVYRIKRRFFSISRRLLRQVRRCVRSQGAAQTPNDRSSCTMRPSQVASLCSGEETILNHTVFDCLNVDTNQVGVELIDMEHSSYVNNVNKTNSPTHKRPS